MMHRNEGEAKNFLLLFPRFVCVVGLRWPLVSLLFSDPSSFPRRERIGSITWTWAIKDLAKILPSRYASCYRLSTEATHVARVSQGVCHLFALFARFGCFACWLRRPLPFPFP
jgi:hypothetical protein